MDSDKELLKNPWGKVLCPLHYGHKIRFYNIDLQNEISAHKIGKKLNC